jgi:hypothetical protein
MINRSKLLIIAILPILVSCQTLTDISEYIRNQKSIAQDPTKFYRYEMDVVVNMQGAEGTIVVARNDSYDIEISAKQKLDLLTARSCHREMSFDPVKSRRGLFGSRQKDYKFTYTPSDLEKLDCPLELYGYSKKEGKHSFAMIDFQNSTDLLDARVSCNGESRPYIGVSICQSRHGLLQQIKFKEPVKVSPDPACPISKILESDSFIFNLNKGICTYIFQSLKTKQTHRLTTIGYEEIIVSTLED